jgi:hypothetical protein
MCALMTLSLYILADLLQSFRRLTTFSHMPLHHLIYCRILVFLYVGARAGAVSRYSTYSTTMISTWTPRYEAWR